MLSHGAQRQLEIAMALACDPKVLLLDEPLAGMGPEEGERMVVLLQSLAREHAVLLIEHDMDFVFKVADRMTVLVEGAVLASGKPVGGARQRGGADGLSRGPRMSAAIETPLIEATDLHTFYDESHILRGVSLVLARGEALGLMGRNGMGKTTLIRTIMGLVRPRAGQRHDRRRGRDARARVPRRAARHRLRAGRPRHLRVALGAREPADRRASGRRRGARLDHGARPRAVSAARPASRAMAATSCPAASSRCSRSRARC